MCFEDIALFSQQLNQTLQTTDKARWAESVCLLFRSYTGAGVRLTGPEGETIAEVLREEAVKAMQGEPDNEARQQKTPDADISPGLYTLPIFRNDMQIGVLTLTGDILNEYDRLAAGITQALFTVLLSETVEQARAERVRRLEAVRGAINSLSFSELEAAAQIVRQLPDGEGLLVAARLADGLKITRSVVVNALRKLEGAGMVETRSLGMKGTYIKVREELLSAELKKL
jgi:GTP-sensing pleiotropic transcriptional regulator CodY